VINDKLINLLVNEVKHYHLKALESITRNSHMNCYNGGELYQETIDALLVDFVNTVIQGQGGDLGLYTDDLYENNDTIPSEEKYNNDILYHNVVDSMVNFMNNKDVSKNELQEMADMAIKIYEKHYR